MMTNKNNLRDDLANVPSDEPIFILRGNDPQAADLVRLWAEGRDFLLGSADPKIAAARQRADAMTQWCLRQDKKPVAALTVLPYEMLATELRRRGASVTHEGDLVEDGLDS